MNFEFIVAIDFGDSSTSVSYACEDDREEIKTVDDWPKADINIFGGRVPSWCLYKKIDELPLWGAHAEKRLFTSGDLFHASNIKSYLTDPDYQTQNPLPDGLNPIKIVADFLQQVHEYSVTKMNGHFKSSNTEQTDESLRDDKIVDKRQIRYIVSYPDNQNEGEYTAMMKEALELAGIISPSDPPERLIFRPESEATAYACTVDGVISCPSDPYIVCDIGRTGFGISTIQADELAETGAIEPHFECSSSKCGSSEPDKNMKKYLENKISASDENDLYTLERVRERVFDVYIDRIASNYDGGSEDQHFDQTISTTGSTIHSEYFDDRTFNFSHEDLKNTIFGPVTNDILSRIRQVVNKLGKSIGGIVISGTIGQDEYLPRIIYEEFGSDTVNVKLMTGRRFAVSRGLIIFGFRENGRMVPYLDKVTFRWSQKTPTAEHDHSLSENKTIDFSTLDYVFGLDFGTSFSGLAVAEAIYCNKSDANHNFVIKEFRNWPGHKNAHASKTPSMLFCPSDENRKIKFGVEAKNASESPTTRGILFRHFKLLLSREYDGTVDDAELKGLEDFEVIDAIKNYLKEFNKAARKKLKEESHIPSDAKVGYIVTIPTMWSDEAKHTMRVAVQKAGLVKKEHINDRVHFITEAEAAAIYCEKYYGDFNMEIGQKFMICDAGGGTVDLVTFQVTQDETTGTKCISELTSGSGGNCGSVFLDEAFRKYILDKFKEHSINVEHAGINRLVDHFIHEIKPNFNSEIDAYREEDYHIEVPRECELDYVESIQGFIEHDDFIIPYIDIEKHVFTPVVNAVLDLIHAQLKKLPDGKQQLDAILVVGGFGKSNYLLKKIQDRFGQKPIGAEVIGKPPNGDLAICKGAVSFGLDPRLVTEGMTRFSYGLQVKDKLSRKPDDPKQKIIGHDGNIYCQNVFSLIVSKESSLKKGHVYVQKVHVTYPNDPVFVIYSSDDLDPPRLITGLKGGYIMRVTAKMPVLYGVRMGEKVPFDFCFELTSTDINVEIRYNDMVLTQGVTKNRSIIRNKFIVKASPSDRLEPGRRWWPNEGLKKKTSHFFLRKNL